MARTYSFFGEEKEKHGLPGLAEESERASEGWRERGR